MLTYAGHAKTVLTAQQTTKSANPHLHNCAVTRHAAMRIDVPPLPHHAGVMSADPVLIAFTARRNPKTGHPVWTRIGQAYPHEVGSGLTVVLDSLPINRCTVLLEPTDAELQPDRARKPRS